MNPTVGSLFAGIGGFDLGFERAGFETVWQVEINPWCRKVLAKNFPRAERYEDIRECGADNLERVDVIVGGFPCQDISLAGKRAGIDGERSGLWSEFARIIRELRPKYVLIENVAALVSFGLERVLCDLAEIGFDAEWEIISAADMGAPHLRQRIWILAYPGGVCPEHRGETRDVASAAGASEANCQERERHGDALGYRGADVAYPDSPRLPEPWNAGTASARASGIDPRPAPDGGSWWAVEPNVGRVAHGVPARVDRLRGLGNAVVPQIPELYARKIAALLAPPVSPITA